MFKNRSIQIKVVKDAAVTNVPEIDTPIVADETLDKVNTHLEARIAQIGVLVVAGIVVTFGAKTISEVIVNAANPANYR